MLNGHCTTTRRKVQTMYAQEGNTPQTSLENGYESDSKNKRMVIQNSQ